MAIAGVTRSQGMELIVKYIYIYIYTYTYTRVQLLIGVQLYTYRSPVLISW